MPQQLTRLTIFISGTAETDAEKGALAPIIDYVSSALEKTHKITLRTMMWPDFRPGVDSDPQAVINEQVGSEFDVYIGILGTRFGSPTPRAGSGTEEEFNLALARFRQDPTSVRVLFYFKRTASDLFSADMEQLQLVRTFRQSLTAKGVLFRDFEDTASFAESVRTHLHHLIIDEWDTKSWKTRESNSPQQDLESHATSDVLMETSHRALLGPELERLIGREETNDDDEAFGLLETTQELGRASSDLVVVLERITNHNETLSKSIHNRTVETNALTELAQAPSDKAMGHPELVSLARNIADQAAADVEGFAATMAADVQIFAEVSERLLHYVGRAQVIKKEFAVSAEQLDEDDRELQQLINSIAASQVAIMDLQATIARLPALTGKVRKARRRAAVVLGEMVAALQLTQERGRELLTRAPESPS